jgi:hypothetical protein
LTQEGCDHTWLSINGRDWSCVDTEVHMPPPSGITFANLHHAKEIWLAPGFTHVDVPVEPSGSRRVYYSLVFASADGLHWKPVFEKEREPSSTRFQLGDVYYADRSWVAVGKEIILTSSDTRTWEEHTDFPDGMYLHQVNFANGNWVAVGEIPTTIHPQGVIVTGRGPDLDKVVMDIEPSLASEELRVRCLGPSEWVYRLQRSSDFDQWEDVAVAHHSLYDYPVPGSNDPVFYRTVLLPIAEEDDWKNQIQDHGDPFLSAPADRPWEQSRWIKFVILLDEPDQVYFQDSAKYVFHYEFARERFARFAGVSAEEFNQVSLYRKGQQVVLGTVIFPPAPVVPEIGIQFVGYDGFSAEQIAEWFRLVESRIVSSPEVQFYYLPVFEQSALATADVDYLAAQHVAVSSARRWVLDDQCYSRGWAIGRLVHVPAAEIPAAYAEGRLGPLDVLLTDAVPAEVPPLAAVLSLSPATPNSHVAILAQSFGTPFGYVAKPTEQAELLDWVGQEVLLMTYSGEWGDEVKVVNAEERVNAKDRQQLHDLKQPHVLNINPIEPFGAISVPTTSLVPSDIRSVGGKAANFGVLARSIPEHAPTEAIALTFDLWNQFLDQTLISGKNLRQTIRERLADYVYPPNMVALASDLEAIRDLIRDEADFDITQRAAVVAALSGFDRNRKIRFRSSTNVEDSEQFTGAGLYDSYSGCLADDLDGDIVGPSQCDPTKDNERGIFRAIKRVYASFYNDNAFLERLRHGINEDDVGMGILVHYSFPDEIEWGNGVATLTITEAHDPGSRKAIGELVTQVGAVSVANPEGNTLPEVVCVERAGSGDPSLTVNQSSALVVLGSTVLDWPQEYVRLSGLLDTAAQAYAALFPEKDELILDFEYKKIAPGRLVVKQIREIPLQTKSAPLLIPDIEEVVVFQFSGCRSRGLSSDPIDLLSNHRLKSTWTFEVSPLDLDLQLGGTYRESDAIQNASARIGDFKDAQYSEDRNTANWSWIWGEDGSQRTMRLSLDFPYEIQDTEMPFVFLSDAVMDLRADYATPQPFAPWSLLWEGEGRTSEAVLLEPLKRLRDGAMAATLSLDVGEWRVESEFDYYDPGDHRCDWDTWGLAGFEATRLLGLVSQPIVLRSEFSQAYATGHHNFGEIFIFEPGIEPGIAPSVLAELQVANIKAVLLSVRAGSSDLPLPGEILGPDGPKQLTGEVKFLGFDGSLRSP